MTVVLAVDEANVRRAGEFMRKHRFDFDTSEATDALAAEFEKLARESRATALKDAAEWVQNVGRRLSSREGASVAFECVNVINARAGDR